MAREWGVNKALGEKLELAQQLLRAGEQMAALKPLLEAWQCCGTAPGALGNRCVRP